MFQMSPEVQKNIEEGNRVHEARGNAQRLIDEAVTACVESSPDQLLMIASLLEGAAQRIRSEHERQEQANRQRRAYGR